MGLIELKPFLDDLVDSFANVLDLEFTILNADPIVRVSGTGKYKNYGWTNSENNFTPRVIATGEPIVVLDTSGYEFNVARENPQYYSILLYPIILESKVEGVLVLASFNPKQQNIILSKHEKLTRYLSKTASLISAKLEQERLVDCFTKTNKQLSTVFESVKNGLILYEAGGHLLQTNTKAKNMMHIDDTNMFLNFSKPIYSIAEDAIKKQDILEKEVHVTMNGQNYSFIVEGIPVKESHDEALCIIKNFRDVQNTITQNDSGKLDTEIVTCNPTMVKIKEKIGQVAKNSSNILLLGESGTGKELFARAIHENSPRKGHPFVSVNCAAIPEALLESELFGYEEGSFTGAKKGGRIGKFMLAHHGTLFLDEIGDMPLYMQAKLLRVLNDKKVDRIGSSTLVEVDVRIIAATNKNLEEMIEKKEFREDLYYRLSVIPIRIPPLRDRKEDIHLLIDYFISKYNKKLLKNIKGVSDGVYKLMLNYYWPGNVRELENCIEYMVNFEQKDLVSEENIPQKLIQKQNKNIEPESVSHKYDFAANGIGRSLKELTQEFHKEVILSMNASYGGQPSLENIREICSALDISLATYYRKLNE